MTTAAKEAAKFLKSTVRLPKTKWPYRPTPADLARYLPRCTDELYAWQLEARPASNTFILHDGPPYANGELHVGHALNKIVKDMIVRTKLAEGRRVNYVPGWDCHGLPIEQKVLQANGWKRDESRDAIKIRTAARKFAHDTVKKQMKGFRSWGVMADWENHWKTLDKDFEIRQLEVFKAMAGAGLIYRKHKPVHWSPSSSTALAEAEIEYDDQFVSTAALIKFPLRGLRTESSGEEHEKEVVYAVVYTTTPWTIPANQAIAINRDINYVLVESSLHGKLVVAAPRLEYLTQHITGGLRLLGPVSAAALLECTYDNLSMFGAGGQSRPIYHADFVKSKSGTGLVHCAPGHGKDDFEALQSLIEAGRVEVRAPVDDQGKYTSAAALDDPSALAGLYVYEEGNKKMLELLEKDNRLVKTYKITHSYPIDWRTKEPVMTRATAQWFADVSSIKAATLRSLDHVTFKPHAGEARLRSFVNNRNEWCISRQRAWGVPIPALYHQETGDAVLTPESIEHIISVVKERGINAWWSDPTDDAAWLPEGLSSEQHRRGTDTMDVWFDSGTSWTFMQKQGFPAAVADVYMEGSDQHRGWFQSSLLTSIAYQQSVGSDLPAVAPFRNLVTHGFTLDGDGRKMSKSIGNTIAPEEIISGLANPGKAIQLKKTKNGQPLASLGPDALRLWAASSDWTKDVIISDQVVSTVHTYLEKYRNTFKLLLGMLSDFKATQTVSYQDLSQLDQIALLQLHETVELCRMAHHEFEFHKAVAAVNRWITADLSGFYIEAIKDIIYCGSPSSHRRHSALTTLSHIFFQFQHMLGPITPLLVEETHNYSPDELRAASEHPHRRVWSPVPNEWNNAQLRLQMPSVVAINMAVKALQERARSENLMGSSLESEVLLCGVSDHLDLTNITDETLKELLVVSHFRRVSAAEGAAIDVDSHQRESWALASPVGSVSDNANCFIVVQNASQSKCARCWKFEVPTEMYLQATSTEQLPLCSRCEDVVRGKQDQLK